MTLLILGDKRISRNTCGGKGYYLKMMDDLGVNISPGFILTNKILERALKYVVYSKIRVDSKTLSKSVYDNCNDKISKALNIFSKQDNFIVRSSFAAEDGATDSYAGIFLTSSRVRRSDIYDAIGKVFASAYSDRVKAYETGNRRKFVGSIIIQKFIDTDLAGTIFTRHPLTGENRLIIEYINGHAEDVVSGNVNPKKIILTYDSSKNINTNSITIDGLSPKLIKAIIKYAEQIENKVIKGPADIEWGIKGEDVYIFQARPMTGLHRKTIRTKAIGFNRYILGIGASSGVAEGRAKHLKDGIKVSKNDILITKYLHPEDTKYILHSGGVITEVGGITSHAAVIARERGIPCITGIRDAESLIKEGEKIMIDGGLGRVYINSKHRGVYTHPIEEAEDLLPEVTPITCEDNKVKRVDVNSFFAEPKRYALLRKGKSFLVVYAPKQSQIIRYKKALRNTYRDLAIFTDKDNFSFLAWMLFMISKHGGKEFLNEIKNSVKSISSLKSFIEGLNRNMAKHLNASSMLVVGNQEQLLRAFEEIQMYHFLNEIKYSIIPKGYAQRYMRESFEGMGFSTDISFRGFLELEDYNGFAQYRVVNKTERSKLMHISKVYTYLKNMILTRREQPEVKRTWNTIVRRLKNKGVDIEKLLEERCGIVNVKMLNEIQNIRINKNLAQP